MNPEEDKYLKSNFLIQGLISRFFRSVKEILSGVEANKVLEVACGPGFSTQYLRRFLGDKHFEASELYEDLVKKAQLRNPGVRVQQESIYELKRQANSFDLILAMEILEEIQEPEAALKELQRVSSRYCLISVPNEPLWRILNMLRLKYLKDFGNTPGHLNHWSKKTFIQLLSKYFKVKKVKSSLPWLIVLVEKDRQGH